MARMARICLNPNRFSPGGQARPEPGWCPGQIRNLGGPLHKLFWSILRLIITLSSGSLPESLKLTIREKTRVSCPGSV